jgi:hypothetical protein
MRPNVKARTGNRVLVVMDGITIGAAQNVRLGSDYAPAPVSGIGDIHVLEYAPTMARHSVSVSQMVIRKQTMMAKGLLPENGDEALQGLVFDLHVMDKDTGEVIQKFISCSYASGDVEVSAHQIVMHQVQLNALDVTGGNL